MKNSVTKFDLEAAFKALDDISTPEVTGGIRANKPALNEIFSRRSKFDSLFEEYYDISSTDGLDDAKEAREAEIAKAKLDRIEKIVDLDAESPEDLLTSYVGKYIIQCPQCMTLFYKNPEDVVESEEDPTTVNIEEVCQHCGNDAGYSLIGKVGEAEPEESENNETDDETAVEEIPEETSDEAESETEDTDAEDLEFDLDSIATDEDFSEDDTEATEESFEAHTGTLLAEDFQEDADLDAKLEAHNEYIDYLRTTISQEESALTKATNEQVKAAIQRRIDAFKEDLEKALPDAIKDDNVLPEETTEAQEETAEVQEEALEYSNEDKTLTEGLKEDAELDTSADDFEKLINSAEFKKPISDSEIRAILDKDSEETVTAESLDADELSEDALTEGGLGLLGKTIKKKLGQVKDNIKSKASAAIDKFADNTMTREEKADWVMKHTLKPNVKEVDVDNEGNVVPDENDLRFDTYIVLGYKGFYSSGRTITAAPSIGNKNIVIGMTEPQDRDTYKEAEELAKGWSMEKKGGPARIFLSKGKNDSAATFLCQFFKGELDTEQDKLEVLFDDAKKDLEGKAHIAKGGGVKGDASNTDEPKTEERQASAIKKGDIIVIGKEGAKVEEVMSSKMQAGSLTFKLTMADGDTDLATFQGNQKVTVVINATTESLNVADKNNLHLIMEEIEELNESALETLISETLIESYKNVAGFRLTECSYLDNALTVDGTVFFESGNTRKISYNFANALKENEKIIFEGFNAKLGQNKNFVLTGTTEAKTFIAESLKQV